MPGTTSYLFEAPLEYRPVRSWEWEIAPGPSLGCPVINTFIVKFFPRYSNKVNNLPPPERKKLDLLVRSIIDSYRPGCRPVGLIRLTGYADRDYRRGQQFENRISRERAEQVQQYLIEELKKQRPELVGRVNWSLPVGAGSANLINKHPRNETERAENRRVEVEPHLSGQTTPGCNCVLPPGVNVPCQTRPALQNFRQPGFVPSTGAPASQASRFRGVPGIVSRPLAATPFSGHTLVKPGPKLQASKFAGAEYFMAGTQGHGGIETEALSGIIKDPKVVRAIYFGNWQRDMSQMLVPVFFQKLSRAKAQVLCELIFEVLDVVAEAEFNRRLDRVNFGTYRWEEHIDNPRDFGLAVEVNPVSYQPFPTSQTPRLEQPEAPFPTPETANRSFEFWKELPQKAIPRYLALSQDHVLRLLGQAMREGRKDRGFELFGAALHTVEDMFAHSNFIEIGYNVLGKPVDPMTGHMQGNPGTPLCDSRGRYRLTTGVFLLKDTVVSLEHILLGNLEKARPDVRLSEKITEVLVRRLIGLEAARAYKLLMDKWRALLKATGAEFIQKEVEKLFKLPLHKIIVDLLQPLVEASAGQTGNDAFDTDRGKVVEISHSRLSKDDPGHKFHNVARKLAIEAAREFWTEMDRVWAAGLQPADKNLSNTRFSALVDKYMDHPQTVGNWWKPLL